MSSCAGCHSAGTVDPGGSNLAGKGGLLVTDLGTISGSMSGITLTAQEILDLRAFLSTVQ
jgi:mono/diheme cytochrome c family protein